MSNSAGFPYISRKVDKNLFDFLIANKYCYIQSPPGTGKSSLLGSMKAKLVQSGIKCAVISLREFEEEIGSSLEKDWHFKLVERLESEFNIPRSSSNLAAYYRADTRGLIDRKPRQALSKFIKSVLLEEISEKIVIIFDDVDVLLEHKLQGHSAQEQKNFRRSFFGTVRRCHELRNAPPEDSNPYKRLTFLLAGSAPGFDLVDGNNTSLFVDTSQDSICKVIKLEDFDRYELEFRSEVQTWLQEISFSYADFGDVLDQSAGHPALTAQLSLHMQDSVDWNNFIETEFIPSWQPGKPDEPDFLKRIRYNLELPENEEVMKLYQQVLQNDSTSNLTPNITPADLVKPVYARLISLGIVTVREGRLLAHNSIFKEISKSWDCLVQPAADSYDSSVLNFSPTSSADIDAERVNNLVVDVFPIPDSALPPSTPIIIIEPIINSSLDETTNLESPTSGIQPLGAQSERDKFKFWFAVVRFVVSALLAVISALPDNPQLWILLAISILSFIQSVVELLADHREETSRLLESLKRKLFSSVRSIVGWCQTHPGLILLGVLIIMLLGCSIALPYILTPGIEADIRETSEKVLRDFDNLNNEPTEIEALQTAIEAGNRVSKELHYHPFRQKHPTLELPSLALQYIHLNIHERNRYDYKEGTFKFFWNATVSSDGKVAATGATSGEKDGQRRADQIMVWKGQQQSDPVPTDQIGVTDLSFSQDGKYLATAGKNGKVKIWEVSEDKNDSKLNLKLTQTFPLKGQSLSNLKEAVEVSSIGFSPNQKYFAAATLDGSVLILIPNDSVGNQNLFSDDKFFTLISSHVELEQKISIDISQNCLVAVGDVNDDRKIKIWSIDENKIASTKTSEDIEDVVREMDAPASALHYLPTSISIDSQGRRIAIGGSYAEDGTSKGIVQVWEFDRTQPLCTLTSKPKTLKSFDTRIADVNFDKHGRLMVIGYQGLFEVWQFPSDANEQSPFNSNQNRLPMVELAQSQFMKPSNDEELYNSKGSIYPYERDADGRDQFVTASGESKIRLWDLGEKPEQLHEVSTPSLNPITKIKVRKAGSSIHTTAVMMKPGSVEVYNNELSNRTPLILSDRPEQISQITSLDGSPDDLYLALGNKEGYIQFRGWDNLSPIKEDISSGLEKEGGIIDLVFNPKPNGDKIFIVASRDQVLFLGLNEEKRRLNLNNLKNIRSISLSSEGKYLSVLDQYSTVKIWDISNADNPIQIMPPQQTAFAAVVKMVRSTLLSSQPSSVSSSEDSIMSVRDIQFYPKADRQPLLYATLSSDGQQIDFWRLPNHSKRSRLASIQIAQLTDNIKLPQQLFRYKNSESDAAWHKISFDSSGNYLAVGGKNQILIWSLTGQVWENSTDLRERLVSILKGDWGEIKSLAFSSDGSYVVAGNATGRLVKINIGNLENRLNWGCNWLNDYHQLHPNDTSAKICQSNL